MSLPKPYYQDDSVTIYHGDCRTILPLLEPVDLVLTDPPYGIGESNEKNKSRGGCTNFGGVKGPPIPATDYGAYNWDKTPIPQDLFDMMVSAGKYAYVWGGNYYQTAPTSCWLIWDKENGANDFADAEMAWTNWDKAVRLKRHRWNGMLRLGNEARFHPTQKPLQVISWAIGLAPKADTILDPFMGSGTTLRAAKDLGRKAIGIELEERYCAIAAQRMAQEVLL